MFRQALSRLSGAQQALVEFLEIDPDLLTAAAAGSAEEWRDDDSAGGWLASLSKDAMLSTFQLLLHGESQEAERRVKADFFAWQSETWGIEAKSAKRRSLAELRSLAEKARKLRLEREAKALARKEAAQRKKRAAYLRALAADFIKHWNSVDALAERGTAASYDHAQKVIAELAEASVLVDRETEFALALSQFVHRHAKRAALMRRLIAAGLWKK